MRGPSQSVGLVVAAVCLALGLGLGVAGGLGGPAEAGEVLTKAMKKGLGDAKDPKTQLGAEASVHAGVGRKHTPSRILIPDQHIPVRFSHQLHLEKGASSECVECHEKAETSVRSSDVLLPGESLCFDCHDANEGWTDPEDAYPPASCMTCHPGYVAEFPEGHDDFEQTSKAKVHPPTSFLPPPHIKFNHRVHVQKGVDCATCHTTLTDVTHAHRDNALPKMGTCLDCHDGKRAPEECRTCHVTRPDGRMQTQFEGGTLVPSGRYFNDAHDDKWLWNHATAAQTDESYCANCHQPKECVDCHNGIRKPLKIHPNDWISQHATAARKNSPECSSCHRTQTFCLNCHTAAKVVMDPTEANPPARLKFHPDGWADFGGRGPNHHAFQAQRNIQACTSCHTEQTCLNCHSMETARVNPHPAGFGGSTQCKRMYAANKRVCSKCHQAGDPLLLNCQ